MKCIHCLNEMHPKRKELGYENCVNCSTESKWGSIPVINHKTGNEIQIVKDPDVVAEFVAKTARIGFGPMRGISSSYKKRKILPAKPYKHTENTPVNRELSRKKLPHCFEEVGKEVLQMLDNNEHEKAYKHIQYALNEKMIFGIHAKQLYEIINVLNR
jgi:hypothetical protein